jgi:hypothetical protein
MSQDQIITIFLMGKNGNTSGRICRHYSGESWEKYYPTDCNVVLIGKEKRHVTISIALLKTLVLTTGRNS